LVPAGRVIGVDPDESMLDVARRKAGPNLEFRGGTLENLDQVSEPDSADLVVSRAALHWLELADYPDCFAVIRRVLKPGGWLHIESGGAGNVYDVRALMDEVAGEHGLPPAAVSFPDAGIVMEMLEETGFEIGEEGVTTVAQRRRFDRQQLLGFLRTQAALAYVAGASSARREAFLDEVEERIDELVRHDGTYDQTFVRLHVLARRPDA
jgi:trans-aconitate methyltransferase